MGPIRLYKDIVQEEQPKTMGPSIPVEEREKLAQMFQQQLQEMKKQQ